MNDSVAKWLRRSVSNLVGSTRVGSNPVNWHLKNYKPAANPAVSPSEASEYSGATLGTQARNPGCVNKLMLLGCLVACLMIEIFINVLNQLFQYESNR